ncbi:hypothetical protein [Bradyrhizobium commune]|uniref:Uncharacterized protein n=1 Tax=Bradyrhizobium commune TaxID=83627 RepID=A0A7S9D4I3_9BRAD|nr:hypothetical protein [Bradyrhizobium commune]QPF90274.1 hypothetical protein IC761_27805 [Bradyrhizobium commune]
MKFILKQAALTFVFLAALYLIVLGVSFVVLPPPAQNGVLDAQAAGNTLYMTPPKYVFLGRQVLTTADKRVIMVGASNIGNGFRAAMVQPLMQCSKVSNLGVGGTNVSQVEQIIDLVHEVQDPQVQKLNTFVIGVWYGLFVESDVRYNDADRHRGDTDIDIERYRYGFARRTASGPVNVVPPAWLDAGVAAIRPILLLEKATREVRSIAERAAGRSRDRTDAEREAAVMTDKQKQDALAYWRQGMGSKDQISQQQVALLIATIDRLLNGGERVVLADLPIPAWHRDASPYYASYQSALQAVVRQFGGQPGFAFMQMSDLDGNEDYSDEVHAKPHLAKVWSARLAKVLNPLVCNGERSPIASSGSSLR